MLLKWICCDVMTQKRAAFSAAQEHWRRIAGLDGLIGQVGGWSIRRPNAAYILGIWTSDEPYEYFMRHEHNRVLLKSGQEGTYDASRVSLVDVMFEIPGTHPELWSAITGGRILRTADCSLRLGRRDHFIEEQLGLWNPAMAKTAGMLAGALGKFRS